MLYESLVNLGTDYAEALATLREGKRSKLGKRMSHRTAGVNYLFGHLLSRWPSDVLQAIKYGN